MGRKNKKKGDGGLPGWFATFSDMMTLLFAFFVLLFSMSSPDPVKMSQIQDAMEKDPALKSPNEIQQEFQDIIEELKLEETTNIISDPRGVALEMDGDICFKSASTEIEIPLRTVLNAASEKILSNWIKQSPAQRMGRPEEIAAGILFTLENDFFQGRILEIDGGLRM